MQCFELWESAIMDQSVTFRKRVYNGRYKKSIINNPKRVGKENKIAQSLGMTNKGKY